MRAAASRSRGGRAASSSALARDVDQLFDLGDRQRLRQRPAAARAFERQRGIVAAQALDEQMLVELPDRRQPPRHGGGAEALAAPCACSARMSASPASQRRLAGAARGKRDRCRGRGDRIPACSSPRRARRRARRGKPRPARSFGRLRQFDHLGDFVRLHIHVGGEIEEAAIGERRQTAGKDHEANQRGQALAPGTCRDSLEAPRRRAMGYQATHVNSCGADTFAEVVNQAAGARRRARRAPAISDAAAPSIARSRTIAET